MLAFAFGAKEEICCAGNDVSGNQGAMQPIQISVVFNNVPCVAGMETAWGFATVISAPQWTVLFDTGGDGRRLLSNMKRLGLALEDVGYIFISHLHADHTGGLAEFLRHTPNVTVFLPASAPAGFIRGIETLGANVVKVAQPAQLLPRLHSTGELGDGIEEQAMVIETGKGLVVITGCAHPGILNIVRAVRSHFNRPIHLAMGGFHLMGAAPHQMKAVIGGLRELGVARVAPSHCTGEEAMALFREIWKEDFLEGGCGAVIELAP